MASRKLGGGRILGSGQSISTPPVPNSTPWPTPSSIAPMPSVASSPSRSSPLTTGLSPSSTPGTLPYAGEDLTSNISLAAPSPRHSGRLACPICQEEMVTLLQLNRHIDDVHQELPEIQQDEVKTWFDKQVIKAKKFQPLSIINQKIRGLEAFESNEHPSNQVSQPATGFVGSSRSTPEPTLDPDELVSRKHWQKSTGHDACTDPTCAKSLGPLNGSINCRSCGKLFCEMHTMYQMKLSRSAKHDAIRGYWCRVCETCYKSRPGYNDHHGTEVELTSEFSFLRRERIERRNLETSRLEKRLTKLTHLLAQPPPQLVATAGAADASNGTSGLLLPVTSLTGHRNYRKMIEQSVVAWENDSSVARCPFCQQEFGSWTFRRHHCRICGKVVCADPQTGCSSEVGLSVATHVAALDAKSSEKIKVPGDGKVDIDIRMCRECKPMIFSKRNFEASIAHKPADQRAYETLRQFEHGIRQMMPVFQRLLQALQSNLPGLTKTPVLRVQIQEAAKTRKRLMDSFAKYNLAAIRLRDLETQSETQRRLQKSVYTAASTFLHANMVPLKHVPKLLRSQQFSPSGLSTHYGLIENSNGNVSHLSPLRDGENIGDGTDSASMAGSEASTALIDLDKEEKELRERLVVLEEQRFLVQEMVDNAHGSRRFEEVGTLRRNAEELDREIDRLRQEVNVVEERWEGLHASEAARPGAAAC